MCTCTLSMFICFFMFVLICFDFNLETVFSYYFCFPVTQAMCSLYLVAWVVSTVVLVFDVMRCVFVCVRSFVSAFLNIILFHSSNVITGNLCLPMRSCVGPVVSSLSLCLGSAQWTQVLWRKAHQLFCLYCWLFWSALQKLAFVSLNVWNWIHFVPFICVFVCLHPHSEYVIRSRLNCGWIRVCRLV